MITPRNLKSTHLEEDELVPCGEENEFVLKPGSQRPNNIIVNNSWLQSRLSDVLQVNVYDQRLNIDATTLPQVAKGENLNFDQILENIDEKTKEIEKRDG